MQAPTHSPAPRAVRLTVETGEGAPLDYVFDTPREAAEMIAFLRAFFPDRAFRIEPLLH